MTLEFPQPFEIEEYVDIPIIDNGEPLVDLRDYIPSLKLELIPELSELGYTAPLVRKSFATRLKRANSFLPEGFTFIVFCAFRPMKIQIERWNAHLKRNRKLHPEWSDEEVYKEASFFCHPPDKNPPHETGGAIDISICDEKGKQLDMGTPFRNFSPETATYHPNIKGISKQNRELLINVMTKAGIVNYLGEWWHWSYGDQYWAKFKNKNSIYAALDYKA